VTPGEIIAALGLAGSLVWNFVNHQRSAQALRIAKFQKHVGGPILDAVSAIERIADEAEALSVSGRDLGSLQTELIDRLMPEATRSIARFGRCLRRGKANSHNDGWDSILDGDIDYVAVDSLARACDASNRDEVLSYLRASSEAFEELAVRARAIVEREE
jgi:hypothetical protein